MAHECGTCWWEDKGTGFCCNEQSTHNLQRVQEDSVCPLWASRTPEEKADRADDTGAEQR